jgi:hypothetical protein
MKILKKLLLLLLILFLLAQFIPKPDKNISETVPPTDIRMVYTTPPTVDSILKTSCYDCHSNNTSYPWYSRIQPVALWLGNHIKEGKRELNFSDFGTYRAAKQFHKLEEVEETIKEGEMPLTSYTLIHTKSKLTEDQKKIMISWTQDLRDTLRKIYPPDSLTIKRKSN